MMNRDEIRVLVADDHMIVRMGIVAMINGEPGMRVVDEVASGSEAIASAVDHTPDLVLLDLKLPDGSGADIAGKVLYNCPGTRVVLLSSFFSEEEVFRSFEAGAAAYLTKDTDADEIVDTVRDVVIGCYELPPRIGELIERRAGAEGLTRREGQVLEALAAGMNNKEIAERFGLAENTVKNHVKGLLQKLGVRDRIQAVTEGLKRGLVDLDG